MNAPHTPQGASHFDVLVLGPFSLFRDGVPIETTGWQRKVQTLLRVLATSPDRRRSRDDLVDILWPEATAEAGFRNLRVVLHMLRKGLDGDIPAVVSEAGTIELSRAHDWDIDLNRLEELAALPDADVATLEQAAGYYRGEPLVEDRYDDWAIAVRNRVQRTFRGVCLRLARRCREAGSPESAVTWLDRVMESDPLDEEALRELLHTLGEMDRRTEALRRYQHFAQRLKSELDLSPGRETQAVVSELKEAGGPPTPVTAAPSTVLVRPVPVIPRFVPAVGGRLFGREHELGRILWTLPPMHEVAPRIVVVAGEKGSGKSRLLAEVAVRARRENVLTLGGSAYEHEGKLQYGPIRDALADYVEAQPETVLLTQLGPLLPDLVSMIPELRLRFPDLRADNALSGEDVRLRVFFAVTKTLDRIAQDIPTVLILDDLQWSDNTARQMLHFVARHLTQNRTLIVAAYRTGDESNSVEQMAQDMEDAGWGTHICLQPLGPDDLGLLVEERIRGRCSAALRFDLHTQTNGNPLQALRWLEHRQRSGRLSQIDGVWTAEELPAISDGLLN